MAPIDSAVTTACACPTTKGDPLCRAVARAFLFLYMSLTNAPARGCSFVLRSQIPIGAGLGSSGSICVCLAAAFLTTRASKRITRGHAPQLSPDDLDAINRWALAGEVCTHGTPSGVDNAISTWGGVLVYRQPSSSSSSSSSTSTSSSPSAGSPSSSPSSSPTREYSGSGAAQPPPSTHFLSSPATATAQQLSVLLIDTNQPRSTRAQLDKVASFTRSHPVFAATLLAAIDALSVSAARLFTGDDDDDDDDATAGSLALRNNDDRVRRLGALMRLNHHLLVALGASHPRVERACEIVAEKGVGWAKLTGAGGGGCVLVLLEPGMVADGRREKLGEAKGELVRERFGVIEAGVGGDGVGVDVSSC
ncbi:putative mevalonate kinase [Diplodia seriata]|uniref:mevalonate kinase n=1 Tax=Diplodia seriata TaxID=420778 RepID=A0A1S8B976_9PEZI|nr:putative mevalonate kinase [Diplodia seriata]